jgi:hypothetical protein
MIRHGRNKSLGPERKPPPAVEREWPTHLEKMNMLVSVSAGRRLTAALDGTLAVLLSRKLSLNEALLAATSAVATLVVESDRALPLAFDVANTMVDWVVRKQGAGPIYTDVNPAIRGEQEGEEEEDDESCES